jgi:hypothetical protein
MIRKTYSIILLSFLFFNLHAGTIDLTTARQVATGFIKANSSFQNINLKQSSSDYTISKNGTNLYYVINLNPEGFVIVPAYDAAPAILGYSFENNYSTEDQPENFSSWMDGYAKIISYLIENNIPQTQQNITEWNSYFNLTTSKNPSTITTVGPLIPCNWNQSAPYNYLCPADPYGSGGHVYAGCVATAMSQVMYYWRYPLQGTGSHGYTWNPYGYLYADFGNTMYKWEEMTNSINGENFEMAQLQSQLGISVDMMYSATGSGAYSQDAAEALKNYFGYDQSLELIYRDDYSYEDWKSILHTQLDAGQPMYYHGFGSGGHAFNVDGYQDTMYFHFNWGWGSSYNGYYHLFNLNPGGSSFTDGQGAIINFIPAGNNVVQCGETDTLTMLAGSMEDGSGPVAPYFNNAACSWLIMPDDTLEYIKLTFHRFDLENGHDFINVYDGADTNAPLIGSFTGNTVLPEAIATSGKMFIRFITDGGGTSNGWMASYDAKQAKFCSGTTTITASSGTFGDGSGSYNYHNNTFCRYELKPEGARSVSITFNELNTAEEGDFIAIYNSATQELYYKLSGQNNPGTLNFNTGELMLIFKTNQASTAQGWDLSYTSSAITGIHEDAVGLNLSVSPNPATTQLQINFNSSGEDFTIRLLSTDGKLVYSENSKSSAGNVSCKIDVSKLQRGLYILQIQSKEGISYQKVILN